MLQWGSLMHVYFHLEFRFSKRLAKVTCAETSHRDVPCKVLRIVNLHHCSSTPVVFLKEQRKSFEMQQDIRQRRNSGVPRGSLLVRAQWAKLRVPRVEDQTRGWKMSSYFLVDHLGLASRELILLLQATGSPSGRKPFSRKPSSKERQIGPQEDLKEHLGQNFPGRRGLLFFSC